MCGIYGMVASTPTGVDPVVLDRMGATLVHRGPDGDGNRIVGRAALGCRRLAIIDVLGGRQPLGDEDDGVLAVCNGEIYNHVALRDELAGSGHHFRTRSDAEVIPHLYQQRGAGFVEALDGMFGAAVWDERNGRLVLARDRMGEKPLYYAPTPAALVFASEPKALLASGMVAAEPEWSSLAAYLRTGYVPPTGSAFAGVASLAPGSRVTVEGERLHAERYWRVEPLLAGPALDLEPGDAAAMLRQHLTHAVDAALVSDVPLGVFLSGGLDSTAVAALARRGSARLATFALGFQEAGFDERAYAAEAASALGTHHRTLVVTPELFLEGLHDLVNVLDEPLADPALVPTFLLARFARAHVKVVLVGEGGDELFAGYPTYLGGTLAAHYARLPAPVRRALVALAPSLGAGAGNTTVRYLLRRFLEAAEVPAAVRHRDWTGCFSAAALARVAATGGPLPAVADPVEHPARTPLEALLAADLTGYLPGDLLVKLDRAAMAASLEGRAPFLDHHLVEFACRLPARLKVRGLETKRVLRQAVTDLVPTSIRRRVKRGLTVPLAAWLAGPLLPFARATLGRLDPHVFDPAAVRALLDEHTARRRDNRRELWALIMLQLWQERWTGAPAAPPPI